MTDFTSAPLENQYETQIVGELSDSATVPFSLEVKTAPGFTLSSGTIYAVLQPGTSKEEGIEINAISGTTLTVSTRGLPTAKGGASTTTTHGGGSKIIITDNWQTFDDISTAIASKVDVAGDTMTGLLDFSGTDHGGIEMINLTTAQRTALSATNGMMVYDTDDSLFYQYKGGAWATVDTGTTVANASETVAGIVELATQAEVDAGTDTGGTGAKLSAVPSTIAEAVQESSWTYAADAEASDTYVITLTPAPDAYVEGQIFSFKANTANTGPATLNVNSLGALDIKKRNDQALATGDIEAGQFVIVQYDGTDLQMQSPLGNYPSKKAGFISVSIDPTDATANNDTSVATNGIPQLILLEGTIADNTSTNEAGYFRIAFEGSTFKYMYDQVYSTETTITSRTLANRGGAGQEGLTNSLQTYVYGSGGNTQTISFSIQNLSASGVDIRVTNTKAGTGGGSLAIDIDIGYTVLT